MRFIAQEMREIMAQLGFRTIDEMVGRVDRLEPRKAIDHWKARGFDFSNILYQPDVGDEVGRFQRRSRRITASTRRSTSRRCWSCARRPSNAASR